jgi:hypothetical protein
MVDRACIDHLGVQQGVTGQQAVQVAAVAIGPVHHGRHGHAPGLGLMGGLEHGGLGLGCVQDLQATYRRLDIAF